MSSNSTLTFVVENNFQKCSTAYFGKGTMQVFEESAFQVKKLHGIWACVFRKELKNYKKGMVMKSQTGALFK